MKWVAKSFAPIVGLVAAIIAVVTVTFDLLADVTGGLLQLRTKIRGPTTLARSLALFAGLTTIATSTMTLAASLPTTVSRLRCRDPDDDDGRALNTFAVNGGILGTTRSAILALGRVTLQPFRLGSNGYGMGFG